MHFVLDASAFVSWSLAAEKQSDDRGLLFLKNNKPVTPSVFPAEARNSFLVLMRCKEISRSVFLERMAGLAKLPVLIDHDTNWGFAQEMTGKHSLTFYDASYLELAVRHQLPIATFDKALVRAAKAEGIPLVCQKD